MSGEQVGMRFSAVAQGVALKGDDDFLYPVIQIIRNNTTAPLCLLGSVTSVLKNGY